MAFLSTSARNNALGGGADVAAGALSGGAERFELDGDEISIGRHPDCNVVVDAGAVSRFHAKVAREGDQFVVYDMGSRNGTFLNGQLLTGGQVLREGDRIRISDIELVFHSDSVPEFASGQSSEMNFSGSSFGIVMVDDEPSSSRVVAPSWNLKNPATG